MKRIIFFAIVLLGAFWIGRSFSPVNSSIEADMFVTIEKGSSLASIAEQLKEKNLIRSSFIFKTYARIQGIATSLQAGTFALKQSLSLSEILRVLHSGGAEQISVTIPEGYTVADIDHLLSSHGLGKPGDIIDCAFHCNFDSFEFLPSKSPGTRETEYGSRLEGFLFPETYAISQSGYVAKFFIERMLGEFRQRIVVKHADAIKASGHTLLEIVTMASLIEEESRHGEERAMVSGILWKRLENRVVLGVDATTRYETKKKTEPLTKVELEADSLYNTRRKQGLPPGPIASPSESSVIATLEPKDSAYWYYLHGSDGVIHYAITAEEHTSNKFKYLR